MTQRNERSETGRHAAKPSRSAIRYHTREIDGVKIFYRESGPADAPVVVLLHGFPTSSHMFRSLIPQLDGELRVIAPDYPGFGQSEMPDRAVFSYTFARFAELVDKLLEDLKVDRYALYVMDYGAPVGLRLALAHPERVTALVVQNGNAYDEGLQAFWDPFKAYWRAPSPERREVLRSLTTLATTIFQYTDGVGDRSKISPDTWTIDQALLDRPGNAEIQLDLFYDYRTNVDLYPEFHRFFRERRPSTLIVWGERDIIFPADGARAFLRDLPDAELHLLPTGHFALEELGPEIAALTRRFLTRGPAKLERP